MDFNQLEALNMRIQNLAAAPGTPVSGQMYYDTVSDTLLWYNGTDWVAATGFDAATDLPDATTTQKGIVQLAGQIGGTATSVTVTGFTLAGNGNANTHKITDVVDPTADQDAATKKYVDDQIDGVTVDDATTTTKGILQLANDLGGTATAPTVVKLTLAGDTAIGHKLTTVTDPTAAQDAATKNYVDTTTLSVDSTLNEISVANPNDDDVDMGTYKIINLVDPTNDQDAATKAYVDGKATGLTIHPPVAAATTGDVTLSGEQTIDGVALVDGDRVLVKDQANPEENGIYIVRTGAWDRAADMDDWTGVLNAYVWVEEGDTHGSSGWVVSTTNPAGVIDTDPIEWAMFSSAAQITAGPGITKLGPQLSANTDGTTINTSGTGNSLQVMNGAITTDKLADDAVTEDKIADGAIDLEGDKITNILQIVNGGTGVDNLEDLIALLKCAQYYSNESTHTGGTTITIPQATHGLRAERGIQVQVQNSATGDVVIPDISVAANGNVTITFGVAQAANSMLVTLVG
jgi:hypothetical protein